MFFSNSFCLILATGKSIFTAYEMVDNVVYKKRRLFINIESSKDFSEK